MELSLSCQWKTFSAPLGHRSHLQHNNGNKDNWNSIITIANNNNTTNNNSNNNKLSRGQELPFRLRTIAGLPGSILTSVLIGLLSNQCVVILISIRTNDCTWREDTVYVSGLQQAVVKLLSDSLQLLIKAGSHQHVVDFFWAQLLLRVRERKKKTQQNHNEAHLNLNNIS